MNNIQKICIMVGIGSMGIFLITIYSLGFSPIYNDYSKVDDSIKRYQKLYGNLGTHKHDHYELFIWQSEIRKKEGVDGFSLPLIFKKKSKINWVGLIFTFNIIVCTTGFFLFKDK